MGVNPTLPCLPSGNRVGRPPSWQQPFPNGYLGIELSHEQDLGSGGVWGKGFPPDYLGFEKKKGPGVGARRGSR